LAIYPGFTVSESAGEIRMWVQMAHKTGIEAAIARVHLQWWGRGNGARPGWDWALLGGWSDTLAPPAPTMTQSLLGSPVPGSGASLHRSCSSPPTLLRESSPGPIDTSWWTSHGISVACQGHYGVVPEAQGKI
jgi:hypothetical protein